MNPPELLLNLVLPEAIDRTRVQFRSYVGDPPRLDEGAGATLDRVECSLYRGGGYSPTREQGVRHFFYRPLCEFLAH